MLVRNYDRKRGQQCHITGVYNKCKVSFVFKEKKYGERKMITSHAGHNINTFIIVFFLLVLLSKDGYNNISVIGRSWAVPQTSGGVHTRKFASRPNFVLVFISSSSIGRFFFSKMIFW